MARIGRCLGLFITLACLAALQTCGGELPERDQFFGKPQEDEPAPVVRKSGDSSTPLQEFLLPESIGGAEETTLYIRSKGGKSSFDCEKESSGKFRCRAVN